MNVYFLGGGNMAAAIAGGLVKQGGIPYPYSQSGSGKARTFEKRVGRRNF